jgi:hypothetical protein
MLAALVQLAERAGIGVRSVRFDRRVIEGDGGSCRVGGREVVLVDEASPVAHRIAILVGALQRHGVQPLFVPPLVRRLAARGPGVARTRSAPPEVREKPSTRPERPR